MSHFKYHQFYDMKKTLKDVPESDLFTAWKLQILTHASFSDLSREEQLYYLACFGLLAPSTHNTVPERFAIDQKTMSIKVYIDKKYVLPESDPSGRQACVSIGCVVGNIDVAAAYYGLSVQYEMHSMQVLPYTSAKTRYEQIMTLVFTKSEHRPVHALLEAILHRKVIRAEYDSSQRVPDALIETMYVYGKHNFSTCALHIITNKQTIHTLGKLEEAATRTVLEKKAFAHELGQWLIPNDDNSVPHAMRGNEFGFDSSFTNKMHKGLLGQERLLPDEIAAFALGNKMMMHSSPAIGIITVREDTVPLRIEVGRMYEYCALVLEQAHFTTAMHAGITEVDRVNRMCALTLKTHERPTAVFRIGKPLDPEDWQRPHSARPQITDILL